MTLTNEDLLAISQLLEAKLKPINERTKRLEIVLENDILPRLQNIEACYTSTYRRYEDSTEEIKAALVDIDIMKKVITEHSEKLEKIS